MRTSHARLGGLLLLALFLAPIPSAAQDALLLPGVDIADIDLSPGAWCRYLVLDEAEGITDSSLVYVAVLEALEYNGEETVWVEFESGPWGAPARERDVSRALISTDIMQFAEGDSLYHYVRKLYIKRGDEPVEPAEPSALQRLTITNPTSDTDWIRTTDVDLETPAGSFLCEHKTLTVDETKRRNTGSVTVVVKKVDRFDVWSSPDVPIFRLAKCVIERLRETRTEPKIPGIPDPGPRESRTTTVLIEHGGNAEPLITLQ